ncbi:MAG: tetratricopeptide repeat protein [Thaumarchaeota archaeon]|nr:tetratricopeptide repeat protein [Nitrososphaerota archaeon]
MSQGQRRLAAIMFTDMVGYTALGQRNESLSLTLVEEQRKLLRPIFARHNGREIKTIGDSFLVEFTNALEAVRCAYDIQRATREFNVSMPEDRRVHLRVGLHLGDVVETEGDISGDAVNLASRIEPLAEDGGVCLTQQVFDHIQNKFELPLESLGAKTLKNVITPMEVYRMVMPWENEVHSRSALDSRRVAILPFASMSPDPNDSFFADGITEEVISTISNVGGLSVISRTSVMSYRGTNKKLKEIGRELEVGSILEGSFRKAGNRIRITAQLIDVDTDSHRWAQSYDREFDNIFAIQSDIAKRIADSLSVEIVDKEARRIETKATGNIEAYTLYLKGRHYWNERTKTGVSRAVAYLEKSIELDPAFALGYAGLAECHFVLAANSMAERASSYRAARDYAEQAIRLDEGLASPHATLGGILRSYDYDPLKAETEFKKALELDINDATAHQWYSHLLITQRRWNEAYQEILTAVRLDPLSPKIKSSLGDFFSLKREYGKAIAVLKEVIEANPQFAQAFSSLAVNYAYTNSYEEAKRAIRTYADLSDDKASFKYFYAQLFAEMGNMGEARKWVKEAEALPTESISPYLLGLVYLALGETDRAFDLFDTAFVDREYFLPFITVEPEFDLHRSNPRYLSLVTRLGLGTER